MRSDLDKKYNRVFKLERSKWTSVKKLNGWRHYEVLNIDKKNNKIELFAVCEKSKRVIVNKEELKNKRFWLRGWKDNLGIDNNSSLMDQLVEGTISMKQAAREVRQKVRRKAELRMLKSNDENKEL